ncbi:MAG: hypoxanthine phosphoribosyltransferase [Verrucomicrobiae bacterium]|nr:hypoxanthine phosphoribosyltransferase [Verrucomicrobiae bacterium]
MRLNEKGGILLPRRVIARRVKELAREIDAHYRGRELVLVGVLNGSLVFLADLMRELKLPLQVDFITASSYGRRTRSRGKILFRPHLKLSLCGAHVLLVDDIFDTGATLEKAMSFLKTLKPASLNACVFLRKRVRRTVRCRPRFVGFDIPDRFVYGYGLDLREGFRHLPHLAWVKERPENKKGRV